MRVVILGAGPAGLYCGYLLRRWIDPHMDVRIVEQNPADGTWGFGVVFSDSALAFLEKDDQQTHDAIVPHMERWQDITVNVQGQTIAIDGVGFTAIGRLELLLLLQEQARSVGLEPEFNRQVHSVEELGEADLIVAADGVNSLVRNTYEEAFGTRIEMHPNKFLWYGTTKPFPTLTQTFRANEHGEFTAHHYRYSPNMSTFLIETNAATWARAGFESLDAAATKTYFEALFAPELEGHPIVENHSHWRNFPKMTQARWSYENKVLVGDALHTAHFSIGSGTRLAMEDVIQLVRSLEAHTDDIPAALADYESQRRPIVDTLVTAANTSLDWYTDFGTRMMADPYEFVLSYLQRSGRVDRERLRRIAPTFMRAYEERRRSASA